MEEHLELPTNVLTVFRVEGREDGMFNLIDAPVYKAHRIHTTSTMSGLWISMIVSVGRSKPMTKDSRRQD